MKIANREIGPRHPVFIIGEAGSNHSGRMEYALELIDVAVDAKADAVKFQLRQMPCWEWLPELVEYANKQDIICLCTPGPSTEAIDYVAKHCPAIKWPGKWSGETDLLGYACTKDKPVLISYYPEAGLFTFPVQYLHNIALLHCVGEYPTSPDHAALSLIFSLETKEGYRVVQGYSDHTVDPVVAPVAAVALGACIIEKHFTLFHTDIDSPDHHFSVTPWGLKEMVRAIRTVEQML